MVGGRTTRPQALVTGASSGIGRELARILARHGYDLVVVARRVERLDALRRELEAETSVRVTVAADDLADPASSERIERAVAETGRPIDVLVNDAGFGVYGSFADADWAASRDLVRVNILALMELTRRFLPSMIARRCGRILNVASTAAFTPGPFMATYYASKAFVVSFSEALSEETRGTGVTVTCLCPGPTRTEFHERAHAPAGGPLGWMSASAVARIGFDGLMAGRAVVVAGIMNRITTWFMRFLPHRLLARAVRRVNAR